MDGSNSTQTAAARVAEARGQTCTAPRAQPDPRLLCGPLACVLSLVEPFEGLAYRVYRRLRGKVG